MEKGDRPSKAGTGKYALLAFRAEKLLNIPVSSQRSGQLLSAIVLDGLLAGEL